MVPNAFVSAKSLPVTHIHMQPSGGCPSEASLTSGQVKLLLCAPTELSTVVPDFGLCDAVISARLRHKKPNQERQALALTLVIGLHLRFFKDTSVKHSMWANSSTAVS